MAMHDENSSKDPLNLMIEKRRAPTIKGVQSMGKHLLYVSKTFVLLPYLSLYTSMFISRNVLTLNLERFLFLLPFIYIYMILISHNI